MLNFKFFLSLFTFFFCLNFHADAKLVKKVLNYKAFYNSSYGKLAFDEVLIKKQIKGNEFLSNIFEQNNLGFDNLISISQLPDSIFDERRIKAGNTYGIIYKEIVGKLNPIQFVYEKNRVDYVTIQFSNKIIAKLGKKEVSIIEKTAIGIINSSLYVTMQANNTNPLLAVSLSEIYAWTIDFYKIQKGDQYKIIYTEEIVEGKSLGAFNIKASIFTHYNRELEAYHYKVPEQVFADFYDEEGGSMRHTFLKAPVKYSRISSRFSGRRFHPVQKRWKSHLGTDYAAPSGTPIVATADGVVSESRYKKYNGNYVKIKHNSIYSTQYLHMSKRAVITGQYVKQGDIIGYVGSTGLATGPHVCYRFWKNGKQVDGNKQDLPKADPIEEQYLKEYLQSIQSIRNRIKNLKTNRNEV